MTVFDVRWGICRFASVTLILLASALVSVFGQSPAPSVSPTPKKVDLERHFIGNIVSDQKQIWSMPFRRHGVDHERLAMFGVATAGLIEFDSKASRLIDTSGSLQAVSRDLSLGAYIAAGFSEGMYLAGRATNNRKAREAGVLATEAMIDSGLVVALFKNTTRRPDPRSYSGSGDFFKGGGMSFPSGHSATIWSVATVFAYEYKDHPYVRIAAYATAAAVSFARYSGRNHFLSEVLVGSTIGFYTGRFVYQTHHVPDSQSLTTNRAPEIH